MKKGLSVLLIAAALFGFYGSAVNLNDILACKDYWEEAGEKSTADMNKLEDGLNQLKENEQAYLDGVDAVAEGEKALADAEIQLAEGEEALADGEKQLADGEKQLADGEKQLAKGEKDYAEAPKKLEEGEKQLEEGYDSLAQLKKLIAGLDEVKKHGTKTTSSHDTYWHDGFSHKVSDSVLAKIAAGEDADDSPGLKQAREVITKTLQGSKDDVALIEGLVGTSGIVKDAKNAKSYAAYDKAMKKAYGAFKEAESQLKAIKKMAETYSATIGDMLDVNLATNTNGVPQSADMDEEGNFTDTVPFKDCKLSELKTGIEVVSGLKSQVDAGIEQATQGIAQLEAGIAQIDDGIKKYEAAKEAAGSDEEKAAIQGKIDELKEQKAGYEEQKAGAEATKTALEAKQTALNTNLTLLKKAAGGREQAQEMIKGVIENYGDKIEVAAKGNADLAALAGLMKAIANNVVINPSTGEVVGMDETNTQFYGYVSTLKDGLEKAAKMLDEKIATVKSSKKTFNDWRKGYKTLAEGKDGKGSSDLASTSNGIPFAFNSMLTNSTIKSAIKQYDKGLLKELKKYTGANKNKLKNEDLDKFDKDLVHIAKDIIPRAQKVLAKVKGSATKQLAAGEKQLAKGKKDYAEAPAKLAEGRQQLADGRARLAEGRAQLEDGRAQLEDGRQQYAEGKQQLADGKAQLAQYEDGEQQVRDGLAQLANTEPDLELESILDRLNGDADFDNGDNHLDLDEGLNAVEVGRGYQADDGVLITKEITARAVGTAGLLGAGALALIAAVLSFLKKNKGAGVFAALAAASGAFGAAYGAGAGTYFSDIAGSTAGSAAWIAAGTLGAVALVHAIVHFASPKNI